MLLDKMRGETSFCPYVNTGTLFDLATGAFKPGVNDSWILNGGLSQCTGISGRASTYKSGLAGSLLARALNVYPDAEAIVYETEGTIADSSRYDNFVPINQHVSDRIVFRNTTDYSLTDFYDDFVKLVNDKISHKKDYYVESPFKDPKTNKPLKCWMPTFILIDSFSRAKSNKSDDQIANNNIDASSVNSYYLYDGNIKTRIMEDLPARASKAGIYVIMTAHVGDKMDLDPYRPSPKQLQYMKNNDVMKNVGSKFEFLTTCLIQTLKATSMQTNDKKCLYPLGNKSSDVEVNCVDTMMVRCKNNAGGYLVPFVLSQYQGLLDTVTNFQFLRDHKNYGMNVQGNNQKFNPYILHDTTITRTNIREISDDYKLRRALELTAQLCFIQNLWGTFFLPDFINVPPEKFAEALSKSEKCSVDRVLNSTGTWTFGKQERERLTILDVLFLLNKEKLI